MQKVWIDQDLCTGDGLCSEICPSVFVMHDDGLAYVREQGDTGFDENGEPILRMKDGMASFPDDLEDAVREAAEECPGECIFIETCGSALG